MKKLLAILLSIFILLGCSKEDYAKISYEGNKRIDAGNNDLNINIWEVDPGYEFDDIDVDFAEESLSVNIEMYGNYNPYGKYEKGGLIFIKMDYMVF